MLFLYPQLSQMQNASQETCPFYQTNLCVKEAFGSVAQPGWEGQLQLQGCRVTGPVGCDHPQAGAGVAISSEELKYVTELEEGGTGESRLIENTCFIVFVIQKDDASNLTSLDWCSLTINKRLYVKIKFKDLVFSQNTV